MPLSKTVCASWLKDTNGRSRLSSRSVGGRPSVHFWEARLLSEELADEPNSAGTSRSSKRPRCSSSELKTRSQSGARAGKHSPASPCEGKSSMAKTISATPKPPCSASERLQSPQSHQCLQWVLKRRPWRASRGASPRLHGEVAGAESGRAFHGRASSNSTSGPQGLSAVEARPSARPPQPARRMKRQAAAASVQRRSRSFSSSG
mmetsp:Transcript_87086/g.259781  ORF Transcript_87086/g.259781 Transcript_87086/m.259781 type:complete len:205 (-) Transcript_87086:86-700(-)